MSYLRSPSVHHLDVNPHSLLRFAGKGKRKKTGVFAAPYNRPALDFFNAHCDRVIRDFGLDTLHRQGRATNCVLEDGRAQVGLSDGTSLVAKNVVLAMGVGEQPAWPAWAPKDTPEVQHVFAQDFEWSQVAPSSQSRAALGNVAVVGGGISAAQVALRLVEEGRKVLLFCRHPLRVHQFDSDPGWLGPKYMKGFLKERDVDARRAMISEARHKGSVPPDVHRALKAAISRGAIQWHAASIERATTSGDYSGVTLECSPTPSRIRVDQVLLATGFSPKRPGGQLVDDLVDRYKLPCAACGFPVVDKFLRWHPQVYVSGPLAELSQVLFPGTSPGRGGRQND